MSGNDREGSVVVNPVNRLVGEMRVPGDKSISHRAAMMASLEAGADQSRLADVRLLFIEPNFDDRTDRKRIVGPVKIHQAYFGSSIVMQVRKGGQVIYQDSVPLAYTALPYGFRPVGFFRLPSEGLNVDLVTRVERHPRPALRGEVRDPRA